MTAIRKIALTSSTEYPPSSKNVIKGHVSSSALGRTSLKRCNQSASSTLVEISEKTW
ncbi:MAG: hypothetical protein QGG29_06460 [Prochlorococcaceae cyanobacterium ETNP18_MAG_17]|nr:hypothetical protein [Prochlorococcaceae cyanobacterium ETNP18_MAG_17]